MDVDDNEEVVEVTKSKAQIEDPKPRKNKRKCRYYERGTCKKGDQCPFFHPAVVCVLFSRLGEGACPDGEACLKSHPTQICEQWIEGKCPKHNKCKLQHPQEPVKSNPGSSKQPERRGSVGGTQRRGRVVGGKGTRGV
eukprot:TRINITY_DN32962_c0_g1_i1.p1 TRINITY_DN32962_c0_g1~~TRINITY_DN32962_c0_g1_i1.p1  ORF type:complete len:138 (-),score=33.01 TRINITY_DN32962_c0_g1_i1:3-416(-)